MKGLVDIHHHILYGMDDDGPNTPEEMHLMLDLAYSEGTTTIIATPHTTPGIKPFPWDVFKSRLEEANEYCVTRGHALTVLPGAELLYTPFTCDQLREGKVPTIAGTRHVLVEFFPSVTPHELDKSCRALVEAEFVPVLAHTERYRCLFHKPSRIVSMKKALPLRVQVNASCFLKTWSFANNRFISFLLRHRLLDFVASDAHNASTRRTNLLAAHTMLGERYPDLGWDFLSQMCESICQSSTSKRAFPRSAKRLDVDFLPISADWGGAITQ